MRNRARTGHYIRQWGVPTAILKRDPIAGFAFAILRFRYRDDPTLAIYCTNGMSEVGSVSDEGLEVRTELFALAKADSQAAVEILNRLARYPTQWGTYFADFDTVSVSSWPSGIPASFESLLLAPPLLKGSVEEMRDVFQVPVSVHQVIPVYEAEVKLLERGFSQYLAKRLTATGVSGLCLDAARLAIPDLEACGGSNDPDEFR